MPKDKVDNYLITINIALIAGYLAVFSMPPQIAEILKWLLLAAFLLYTLSLLLLIWFFVRYPKRAKVFEELKEKTVTKFSDRIAHFIEDIATPYSVLQARLETREKYEKRFQTVENKKDYKKLRNEIETELEELKQQKTELESGKKIDHYKRDNPATKATEYVIESFLSHMAADSQEDYKKAFKSPLEEKHAKIKLFFDQLSFRFRRHIFAAACVLLFFSVLIKMLTY